MGKFITDLAQQGAQGAVGAILGLGLGNINDKRQLKQQKRLQDMQIQGQNQLASADMARQLQMWKDTNFSAQMAEIEKAGLSPGLIYGMGGAGGATTGQSAHSVGSGDAPKGGGEAMGMALMTGQMGLLRAQKENIEADTANKRAGATFTEGAQTTATQAQAQNTQQNTLNQKATEEFTKTQTRIAQLDERLKGETLQDMIDIVDHEEQIAINRMDREARENVMSKATYDDRVSTIKADMFGAWIRNAMMKQGIAESKQQIEVMKANIKRIIQQNVTDMRQDERNVDENNRRTMQVITDQINKDIPESAKVGIDVVEKAVQAIILKGVLGGKPEQTPVRGFHNR